MVSPSKKHSRVASHQPNKCKLIKGQKPLINYRFYLDIEKHQIANKIETKIKELGGSIEFFLAKDVTHFVTDKILNRDQGSSNSSQAHTPKTPLTPFTPYLSEPANVGSPNVSSSNESRATCSKPLSRADAMLQKVRDRSCENSLKSTNISNSPIQLAKTWGTPIWSTEYTIKFLQKLCAAIKSDLSHHTPKGRPANVKHLHGDYIKIESFSRNYRPYFQEIKHWPTINLRPKVGYSPFAKHDQGVNKKTGYSPLARQDQGINRKTPANRSEKRKTISEMTRKSRSKQMRTKNEHKRTSEKQCGYCEVCRIEYDVLSVHLQSKEHTNFVNNSDNYLSLDNLISNSANVDTFLKMNSAPPKNDYDSGLYTKRACRKFKEMLDLDISNADSNSIKSDYVRMNGSAKMVTRRSNNRKSQSDSRSCVKSSPAKVENNFNAVETESAAQLRSRRESVKRINYAEPREDEENADDLKTKIRIRGIRWRPPSPADDNLSSASQPAVYKIGKGAKTKDNFSDQNKDPQSGLKVKICRVRESELSLLTNEADKFMFPPCLSDRPTDEDRESSTDHNKDKSTELTSSDADTSKKKKSYDKLETNVKRKRRNQLQSFLEDNSDYYKFEKPDTRLRFPEAPIQSTPSVTKYRTMTASDRNSDLEIVGESEDRMGAKRNNQNEILASETISRLKYSFERVPSSEPWYDAFQRQDECRERVFEYWGNTAYRKLPYEIGPMPPLPANCCSLSKLAHKKVELNKIDRRFKIYRDQKKLKEKPPENDSDDHPDPLPQTSVDEKSLSQDIPLKASCEIANVQKNGSTAPKSRSPVIFASGSNGTRSDSGPILTVKSTPQNDVNKSHKRNLNNDFTLTMPTEAKEIKVKSAISTSRRNSLLDINGQPRKSPREHASTLAILSCLVQERKKREKALNGGISPDKMQLNDDDREQTSDGSYGDESSDTVVLNTAIKQEVESCDEYADSNDLEPNTSMAVTNIKSEQDDELPMENEKNESIVPIEPTKEDVKEEVKHPRMPRSDYVNPAKLYKEIDNLLQSSQGEDDILPDVVSANENTDDLVLIGTPKDFVEILLSTTPGPLRYRSLVNIKKPSGLSSFSRCKKRRNNKTGWPTIPKRRILIKKEVEEDSNSCSLSVTEPDEECDDNRTTHDDRVDISDQLGKDEFFIHSRQKLNSMGEDFSKDDEYSNDVSSDSLDTDVTESNNKQQLDKDYDVISIVNVSDEDTSSADVTLAEMLKKQIGVGDKMVRCNRQKSVKKSNKIVNNVKLLQPIIYVKKINETETLNTFITSKTNSTIKDESIVRNNSSPNTKCSPRKLRKPRGLLTTTAGRKKITNAPEKVTEVLQATQSRPFFTPSDQGSSSFLSITESNTLNKEKS
ncbi:Protein chiffon [Pseudolycoriella hygida]|uniref:Protein chiffon n=1 Tax=Pseudolycoriella hygida TaxID=35572 RepID=A0A9Q0N8E9_9DIPT|nr:Protein chiffon [Pseudolycoriella hygida]